MQREADLLRRASGNLSQQRDLYQHDQRGWELQMHLPSWVYGSSVSDQNDGTVDRVDATDARLGGEASNNDIDAAGCKREPANFGRER